MTIKIALLIYHIINAKQTFFCWSSNILTRNSPLLMLFIAIARTNSKYSYHYEKFEFLKYSYQKRMGRVLPKISDLFSPKKYRVTNFSSLRQKMYSEPNSQPSPILD